MDRLATQVERRLGIGFPLATYIRQGFAYHHGQLPDDLRRAIEGAFRRGCLPILIATPTLAQGVNLPVHLMIVANLERGKSTPFPVRDFRNIAGRAGRALHETEGHVIFVQNTRSRDLIAQISQYLLDDKVEQVRSVLFELYEKLVQRKVGISLGEFLKKPKGIVFTDEDCELGDELNTAFQTQVLALLYEGLLDEVDPDTVQNALAQMLFGVQCERGRTYYQPLVEYGKQQVRYVTARFQSQAQKAAFYRMGFSMGSCQRLENEVRRLAGAGIFGRLRDPVTKRLNHEVLVHILRLTSIPGETQEKEYTGPVDLAQAMVRWINFADLNELATEYEKVDSKFQVRLFVSDLVYRHFVNHAPWALNSVVKILAYLRDEEGLQYDLEIRLLPSYVKYGVNTPVAAFLSGTGIGDRETVRAMASYYYQEPNVPLVPSVGDFQDWLQGLTFEDLLPVLGDRQLVQEVATVLRRYRLDIRPVSYLTNPNMIQLRTYVVGLRYENRLEYLAQVKKGDELKLVRELDNAFDPYAMAVYTSVDQKLGYIPSSKAFILSTLADEGWEFRCYAVHVYSAPRHPNRRLMVFIPPPSPVPNVTA